MTHFLLHLFLKNRSGNDPASRAAVGRMAAITGILCNCLLFLGKLIAGILVGSIAIIADSVNNLSDAVSSVVTLIGFYLAQRPADRDHPYGHARYEYLAGLIVAEMILLVGFELGKSSIEKIIHPDPIPFTVTTFIILLVSILLKFWMSHFYRTVGQKIHSGTLEAASADSRNDVVATSAVLVSCAVGYFFHIQLDGFAGLAVAIFIFWSGIQIAKDTISPLLGMRADGSLVTDITDLVTSHDKVLGVHDLLIHDYGPGQCFASVHAEMDAESDPLECHDLLEHIECEALDDMNVHLVIHCDPVATNDEKWDTLRAQINQIVTSVDSRMSIHDFRILQDSGTSKLVFDLDVPFDCSIEDAQLHTKIQQALLEIGIHTPTVIHIDRTN